MTAARPILIVENDHDQREILVRNLNLCNEFEISVAATFSQADALLGTKDARFDAIILGLGMPDGTGYDYLAELRRQGRNMPIIIVTDSCNEADIVRGLDAGASDYMTKPLRLNELLARLRAQVRIFDKSEDATFTIGQYAFRPAAKLLMDQAKRRLHLTNKELRRSHIRLVDRHL